MRARTDDPHGLDRFVAAQATVWDQVLRELAAGRKRTHWMWFIFPQLAGLGVSETARFYALRSLEEAAAYLAHPVLGARLREATALTLERAGATAHGVFGSPDDLKFRSCMTLFARAEPAEPLFEAALARFYGGAPDPATVRLLGG